MRQFSYFKCSDCGAEYLRPGFGHGPGSGMTCIKYSEFSADGDSWYPGCACYIMAKLATPEQVLRLWPWTDKEGLDHKAKYVQDMMAHQAEKIAKLETAIAQLRRQNKPCRPHYVEEQIDPNPSVLLTVIGACLFVAAFVVLSYFNKTPNKPVPVEVRAW